LSCGIVSEQVGLVEQLRLGNAVSGVNGLFFPRYGDEAICGVRKQERAEWKRQVGCHRRSLSETAMYRMKTIFGPMLKNRHEESQKTKTGLRCKILNHFFNRTSRLRKKMLDTLDMFFCPNYAEYQ